MRLLEYQAKELFKEFGIRVPESIASKDIEQGTTRCKKIGLSICDQGSSSSWRKRKSRWNPEHVVVMMNLR